MIGKLKNIERIGVSVVIVTYNGRKRLQPTLEHILQQKDIDFDWELLIVDNNSSDGTSDFVRQIWKDNGSNIPLRIVAELKQGNAFARKRGIEECKYRYLLFCDDDNWLNNRYLKSAYDIILQSPDIAAVGGVGRMRVEDGFEAPPWVTKYEKNYGCGAQGNVDGETTNDKGCLYSAGIIIDRIWIQKLYSLGFMSNIPGRVGKSVVGGEDTELTYALKLVGGKLYYSSKMHFLHYMPKERLNLNYLKRIYFAAGYGDFINSPYNAYFSGVLRLFIVRKTYYVLKNLIKYFYFAFQCQFELECESVLRLHRTFGEIKALLCKKQTFFRNVRRIRKIIKQLEKEKCLM